MPRKLHQSAVERFFTFKRNDKGERISGKCLQKKEEALRIQTMIFWGGKVNEILRLSKWFQLATDMVQSESATLLDVAAALKGLRLKIQNWNVHNAFGITERKAEKFKDDAMSVIHRRELSFIRAQDHHALRSA